MTFLKKHWLGLAVLTCLVWLTFAVVKHDLRGARLPSMIFWVFFVPWVVRGFIRFVSRAWHHGARTGTSGLR